MEKNSPRAFIFDVFGTVVDWRSGVSSFSSKFLSQRGISVNPDEFADLWRAEYQPSMERIRSGNRGYVPLDILHQENLVNVLERLGLSDHFSKEELASLNTAWEHLPAWGDSAAGIMKIKQSAFVAPCSNGSIALMTRIAKYADLQWDCILGAEIAQNYKPHQDAYLKSVKALGLEPYEVVMVAAHNDDLFAARKYGLKTAFIPRPLEHGAGQQKDLRPEADWDFCADSILDLADQIKIED